MIYISAKQNKCFLTFISHMWLINSNVDVISFWTSKTFTSPYSRSINFLTSFCRWNKWSCLIFVRSKSRHWIPSKNAIEHKMIAMKSKNFASIFRNLSLTQAVSKCSFIFRICVYIFLLVKFFLSLAIKERFT